MGNILRKDKNRFFTLITVELSMITSVRPVLLRIIEHRQERRIDYLLVWLMSEAKWDIAGL